MSFWFGDFELDPERRQLLRFGQPVPLEPKDLSLSGESDRVLAVVRGWRVKTDEALVVVDQFEELFTLNAPETQSRFASLLGRLADEAGVHVLLSLRDDFLFLCGEREGLRQVFERQHRLERRL